MVGSEYSNLNPKEFMEFSEKARASKTINAFDFTKAISIIKENKIRNASFGLDGDWRETSDICLKNGKVVTEHNAYVNGCICIPTLRDEDTGVDYPCFTVEDKDTYITRYGWTDEEIEEINSKGHQVKLI